MPRWAIDSATEAVVSLCRRDGATSPVVCHRQKDVYSSFAIDSAHLAPGMVVQQVSLAGLLGRTKGMEEGKGVR